MPVTPETEDLDLPPIDGTIGGEEDDGEATAEDLEEEQHALGDALDDSTSEGDPLEEIGLEGAEGGWLEDSEGTGSLDVGGFDLSLSDEGKLLDPDEPERPIEEDLGGAEEVVHADGGEEGPLADDEELREEDLPALDADDDGDVKDESLYERTTIDTDDELRWDDRAWARAPVLARASEAGDDAEDSGMLAVPGEDAKYGPRDATWRRLEEAGGLTAAVLVPGESVVVAIDGPDRPFLVRILASGVARIIAQIDTSTSDDEVEACRVTALRWDAASGCLIATGTFGAQAFRPA